MSLLFLKQKSTTSPSPLQGSFHRLTKKTGSLLVSTEIHCYLQMNHESKPPLHGRLAHIKNKSGAPSEEKVDTRICGQSIGPQEHGQSSSKELLTVLHKHKEYSSSPQTTDRWFPGKKYSDLLVDKCSDRWSSPVSSKKMPSPKCVLDRSGHHVRPASHSGGMRTTAMSCKSTKTRRGSSDCSTTTSCSSDENPSDTALILSRPVADGISKRRVITASRDHYITKEANVHIKGFRRPRGSSSKAMMITRTTILQDRRDETPDNPCCRYDKLLGKPSVRTKPRSRSSSSTTPCHNFQQQLRRHSSLRQQSRISLPVWDDLMDRKDPRRRANQVEEDLLLSLFTGFTTNDHPLSPPPPPSAPRRSSLSSCCPIEHHHHHHHHPNRNKTGPCNLVMDEQALVAQRRPQDGMIDGYVLQSPRGTSFVLPRL